MKRRAIPGACLVFPLALGACGPSEQDARQYLEGQRMNVTSLKRSGDSFEFTAKKDDEVCTGTVTVKKGFGTTSSSHFGSCQRDTSACKPGAAAACVQIADELYGKNPKVFPTLAAELYRTACADGNGRACGRAAEYETIGKNWHKVREYAEKGCNLNDGESCATLGRTEMDGNGTVKNQEKGIDLLKKACSNQSMRGCRGAAGLLLDRTPPDPAGALPLAEKACLAKYEDSCFVVAVALIRGEKNDARAIGYADAACSEAGYDNRGFACNIAGAITADGLGVPKDPARAVAYFEKSCEQSFGEGCKNAATMYKEGRGVPRDKAKVTELLAKACKLGKQEACSAK